MGRRVPVDPSLYSKTGATGRLLSSNLRRGYSYEGAGQFIERYGPISPETQGAPDRLAETVLVDIRPHYAVQEIMADW